MNLKLSDSYRVTTDPLNFILEKFEEVENKKTKEKSMKWKTVGYFSYLEHALQRYVKEVIRDIEVSDIYDLIRELNNIREDLKEMFVGINDQILKTRNHEEKVTN